VCSWLACRIEDTDLARSTKESETNLMEELKWLGIDWDEGKSHSRHPDHFDVGEGQQTIMSALAR
jgi:glutamyl/glutaminyl-tRNA synthetase